MNNQHIPCARLLGAALTLACLSPLTANAASTLTAETSRPAHSTFAAGEPVVVTFAARGVTSPATLAVTVKDENDAVLSKTTLPVQPDAQGSWTIDWSAPTPHLGFYRVYAALSDGTTVPRLRDRPAGYITYAVVPDPAKRVDYGEYDSMFGMQGGFSTKASVIPYLGVRWVLQGFNWDRLEKDHPGQFAENRAKALAGGAAVFPEPNAAVDTVTYAGQRYNTYDLPCLNGTPLWAQFPGTAGSSQAALSDSAKAAWKAYCTEVAKAYAHDYPARRRHLYQITWEPIYPWGFKGTNDQLVEIYRIAYPALHAADPQAFVLGPTGDGISRDAVLWNDDIFKAGIGKYVDGVSIHPYCTYPPEKTGLVDYYRQLKDVIRAHTGRDLPLFGTEQGYATRSDEGPAVDLVQAKANIREGLITAGEGFSLNMTFYVSGAGYDYYYNCNPRVQFGSDKLAPKPSVPAYAAMTWLIDGHPATGPIDWLGGTSCGYVFQRGDDVILALWDSGDNPRKVSLPVGVKQVMVYDWMGNGTAATAAAGNVDVTLTQEPVYVKGVSTKLWGRLAVHPVTAAANRITAFPGDTVVVTALVTSPTGKPGHGDVRLDADTALNAPAATKPVSYDSTRRSVALRLAIPTDCAAGAYPLKLTLTDGASAVGATGVQLVVKAPVTIQSVGPEFASGQPALRVAVANATPVGKDAKLAVRVDGVPDSRKSVEVRLTPSSVRQVIVPLPGIDVLPTHKYAVETKLSTVGSADYSKNVSINFMTAPRLTKPVSIDADLADWPKGAMIDLHGASAVVRSREFFSDALKASAIYAWDAKALYVAFDVTDPVFIQTFDAGETWRGDCLQLGFNLDPDKASASTGNDFADQQSRRYTELTVALTTRGVEVYRGMTYDRAKLAPGLVSRAEIPAAIVKTATGLRYEMAIPWRALGADAPPKPGDRIGIAATVNDMNREDQRDPTALGLFDGIASGKDPAKFGQVVLGE